MRLINLGLMASSIIFNSAIGRIYLRTTEKGLTRLVLDPGPEFYPQGDQYHPILVAAKLQLEEYFEGKLKKFKIPIDWEEATPFNKSVWKTLLRIPSGTTVSYSDIAKEIGSPKAVRAIGLANRNNPIPIIIPCHRVIGKSGDLHGFVYGLDMKQRLLHIENPVQFPLQKALF